MNMSEHQEVQKLVAELEAARALAAARVKPTTRYITLQEWAQLNFSKVPHNNTLLRWVHEGRIQPQPIKIGRVWQVKPAAEYISE